MGKAAGWAVVGCGIDDGGVVPGAAKMPNADLQTVIRTVSRFRPVARTPFPGAFAASTAQPRVFGPSLQSDRKSIIEKFEHGDLPLGVTSRAGWLLMNKLDNNSGGKKR
jgi:hypothetical protein